MRDPFNNRFMSLSYQPPNRPRFMIYVHPSWFGFQWNNGHECVFSSVRIER